MIVFVLFFWLAILEVFWSYLGYLGVLTVVAKLVRNDTAVHNQHPQVSIIIVAHNEERRIAEKLENTLALDYPPDLREIIVVSDASTDATDRIVKEFQPRGVKLVTVPVRRGKHYGQRIGIGEALTDIIILTDATTFLQTDTVTMLARNFGDPKVGCVSSFDRPGPIGNNTSGEGAYVKYEMYLRVKESQIGSLVGASGCCFAVRKQLCGNWIDNMSSDFYLPIMTRLEGMRSVLESQALAFYTVHQDPAVEFRRKVRTVIHGIEVLFRFKSALNPFRTKFFALELFSHKLCRWLVPFSLVVLLASNTVLFTTGLFYKMVLAAQLLFYVVAILPFFFSKMREVSIFRFANFFVIANVSIIVAWFNYLLGRRYVTWEATKR